jgi:hypothetical protein
VSPARSVVVSVMLVLALGRQRAGRWSGVSGHAAD